MRQTLRRHIEKPVCSALLASVAFVALLLPIVTPGLNPALVGNQAFHGHIAIDGVVEPHSHDVVDAADSEIVFTSDDSGSVNGSPVIISPEIESFASTGPTLAVDAIGETSSGQWAPKSPLRPPLLST